MNKKTLAILIALAVLVAAMAAAYFLTRPQTADGEKAFTLIVVHGDGTQKEMPMRSAAQYLGDHLQAEGIISGEEGQYGLYIKVVDGEKAVYEEDNAYWGFFVGEEYAMLGIDQTPIEDGATYKLVYTPAS